MSGYDYLTYPYKSSPHELFDKTFYNSIKITKVHPRPLSNIPSTESNSHWDLEAAWRGKRLCLLVFIQLPLLSSIFGVSQQQTVTVSARDR
jgi:hypothetical protein